MLKGAILLISGVAAVLFAGRWWPGHGDKWRQVGELPTEFTAESVAVSADGVGLIGGYVKGSQGETTLEEQMSQQVAVLLRLEGKDLEKVYEGTGYINSVHSAGVNWFAVVGILKGTGVGSNYRLIGSSDHARSWKELGNIPARSIAQILSVNALMVYVFGVNTLWVTEDGGKRWNSLPFPEVANSRSFTESIALARDGGLLAFGSGLMLMRRGASAWERILTEEFKVEAISDPFLAAVVDDKVQLFRRTRQGVAKISELPEDRLPVRVAAKDKTIQVITHPRRPEKAGFFPGDLERVLFRSKDGGKSWKTQGLKSIQKADLSGAHFGIGVDTRNGVFSTKAVNVK